MVGESGVTQKCLMLGAGHRALTRQLKVPSSLPDAQTDWYTLDYYVDRPGDPRHFNLDLNRLHTHTDDGGVLLVLPGAPYDEIHAYEVLEHFGQQGNPLHFFRDFNALWRSLVPGGHLIGSTPSIRSPWLWGDPSHTRVISGESLSFVQLKHYDQLGKTPSSDFRDLLQGCYWEMPPGGASDDGTNFRFALRRPL